MKRKILSLFLICTVVLSLVAINVSATGASVSKSEVYVGDSVTVTFTVKGNKAVGSVDAYIDFDDTKLTYVEKSENSSLGGIMVNVLGQTIKVSDFNASNTSATYTLSLTFKAKTVGDTTVTLRSIECAYTDLDDFTASDASVTVSVKSKNTSLSSNCDLKDLQPPAGCKLSPAFSSSITEYTCTVPYSVKSFPLEPVRADSTSKVSYFGSVSLNVGENTRGVKVTAQDGTVKTYTVKITRLADTAVGEEPTPTVSVTPTPNEKDLNVTADGKNLTVMEKILSELPQGFEKTTGYYNGNEVEVGVLGDLEIFELTDGETSNFYFISYNKVELYVSISITGTEYTVLSETEEDMNRFDRTEITLPDGRTVNGWQLDALGEGYYAVSVVNNATGENYIAVYCAEDGTLQKISSKLIETKWACGTTDETPQITEKKNYKTLFIGVCCLIVAIIIALIIVIVKKNDKTPKRTWDFDGESDPYGINEEREETNYQENQEEQEEQEEQEQPNTREEEIYMGDESDFE